MMKKLFAALLVVVIQMFPFEAAHAGADITGIVQNLQIAADGKIWFSMSSTLAPNYCKVGWNGLNMYIPSDSPQYTFYYGLLLASLTKEKTIYLGNISVFDGSAACDITKTGYGIVLFK